MSTVIRYDVINVPQAQIDANGWIRDKPILTRTGIFIYRDAKGKTTREYRSPEEVFKADSLATLVGIPITDKHVGIKTADNVDGILGTVIGPGEQSGANVVADLIIHNPKRLGNRRELSLGYRAIVNDTPGVTSGGEHYDTVQTDIVYNHLAVVEKGRAGNARLRLDGTDAASGDFVTEEDMADGPKLVMVKIDEIEYAAAQEVARALVRLQEEATQRASGYDSLQAERDSLKGQVAEATQILANAIMDGKDDKRNLVDLSKLLVDQSTSAGDKVRSRIILEERAKKHAVVFDDKTTDRKLKEDIATKLTPSIKFDGKSDDYVNSAFDIAIEMNAGKDSKVGDMRAKGVPKADAKTFTGGASAARAKMVENIRIGRGA